MKEETKTHPLFQFKINKIVSWKTWLATWQNQDLTQEQRIGLLHVGFSVPIWSQRYDGGVQDDNRRGVDRICFYLEIADGYQKKGNFARNDDDYERRDSPASVLHEIAVKAWKVLCKNFLKNTQEIDWKFPSWAEFIVKEDIFRKLLWFFNPINGNIPHSECAGEAYEDKIARNFLMDLIRFVWQFERLANHARRYNPVTEKMFAEARPQTIEILQRLGKLSFLLECNLDPKSDRASMKELKRLALRKYDWSKERYRSVEQAYYAGSSAARTFILLNVSFRQKQEERRIEEAKRKRNQEEYKQRQLEQAKQQQRELEARISELAK